MRKNRSRICGQMVIGLFCIAKPFPAPGGHSYFEVLDRVEHHPTGLPIVINPPHSRRGSRNRVGKAEHAEIGSENPQLTQMFYSEHLPRDWTGWQELGDSNPRPSVLETDALPTELNS